MGNVKDEATDKFHGYVESAEHGGIDTGDKVLQVLDLAFKTGELGESGENNACLWMWTWLVR
jgi:hypothetical protein